MLLEECEKFGIKNDIIFNANKSAIMCYKSNFTPIFKMPDFTLNSSVIPVVKSVKYLGHFLSETTSDSLDIARQRKKLFIQGNSLIRKFYMCTIDVKLTLFQSFCSPMYTAQLWTSYSNNDIMSLCRAYHNTLKILLGVSKREYTSPLCAFLNIRTCPGVIRNLVFRFIERLKDSSNSIIKALYGSSTYYKSAIWKHWRSLLYTNV